MIFTIKDERTGSYIRFFLGEPIAKANKFAKDKLHITDYYVFPDEMDGASYMFRGRGVVWLHKTTCEGIVKLYKVLLHEILHCCYHFDRYWEDDDAPEKYDICVKSEANIIGFAEYFFGKAMEKIIKRVKKRGK
tara:strand:+ start:629 stop:1030 length:402 start_codon:yes stop_codon:yes gene_type:complete